MAEDEQVNWDDVELNIETEDKQTEDGSQKFDRNRNFLPNAALIKIKNSKLSGDSGYGCFLCGISHGISHSSTELLEAHIVEDHQDFKTCLICQMTLTSVVLIIIHLDIHHSDQKVKFSCMETATENKICFCRQIHSTTFCPFLHTFHMIRYHTDKKITTIHEAMCFVCVFCKCGFVDIDNLFLHLMKIHDLEWDVVFKAMVYFKMLKNKLTIVCRTCPQTFETEQEKSEHSETNCELYLEKYNIFSRFCGPCHFTNSKLKLLLMRETSHDYCIGLINNTGCVSAKHFQILQDRKRNDIVYSHCNVDKQCRCSSNVRPFQCPKCDFYLPTFRILYNHYGFCLGETVGRRRNQGKPASRDKAVVHID